VRHRIAERLELLVDRGQLRCVALEIERTLARHVAPRRSQIRSRNATADQLSHRYEPSLAR
jgi:hypothetical protein